MKQITIFVPPEYEQLVESPAIYEACQDFMMDGLEEYLQQLEWMQERSPGCFETPLFNSGQRNRRTRTLWRLKNNRMPTDEELQEAVEALAVERGRARKHDPDTSKEAAARFTDSMKSYAEVLAALHTLTSATSHELAIFLGKSHASVSPRICPLREMGFLEDSGLRQHADGRVEEAAVDPADDSTTE